MQGFLQETLLALLGQETLPRSELGLPPVVVVKSRAKCTTALLAESRIHFPVSSTMTRQPSWTSPAQVASGSIAPSTA